MTCLGRSISQLSHQGKTVELTNTVNGKLLNEFVFSAQRLELATPGKNMVHLICEAMADQREV